MLLGKNRIARRSGVGVNSLFHCGLQAHNSNSPPLSGFAVTNWRRQKKKSPADTPLLLKIAGIDRSTRMYSACSEQNAQVSNPQLLGLHAAAV